MNRFILISGCSGGGKSTLLDELARQGLATIGEPGRRVVRDELASAGDALPWIDALAFVRRIIAMARIVRLRWRAAARFRLGGRRV